MIKPGTGIRVYDAQLFQQQSFFTGGLNLKQLAFDPLLTGYAFIVWTKLPKWVVSEYPGFKAMTEKNFKGFSGLSDMELNTQSYAYGFSSNEYNIAAGIQKQNTEFSLIHQEYSGSPIKNGYAHWVSNIADPETDIATYPRIYNMEYAAKNHTGELMYIVTRPDANNISRNNIEFAAYYTNVFPTKIPIGHFEFTQGSHDMVEVTQSFKGNLHISHKVDEYAKKLLATTYSFVTEGLFDPENANVGGKTMADFDTNSGSLQQGLGDI